MKIILASGSSRRREILSGLGYDFGIVVPEIDENIVPGEPPAEHVLRISGIKAEEVAREHLDDLVIGADTAVVLQGEILGKPASEDEAFEMLKKLSGRTHTVYTGLTLMIYNGHVKRSDYDRTEVTFNVLPADGIREYIKSREPLDKAGSYGIQGMGSFLVKKYDGELNTVIGFPSKLFLKMYEEVNSCLNH